MGRYAKAVEFIDLITYLQGSSSGRTVQDICKYMNWETRNAQRTMNAMLVKGGVKTGQRAA